MKGLKLKVNKLLSKKMEADVEKRRKTQREHSRNVEVDETGIALTRNLEGNIRGRHKGTPLKVDWGNVEKLLHIQCTQIEVAGFLNVSVNTLSRRCKQDHGMTWTEYSASKGASGRASLRRKQWLLADKSSAMAIFLGKNYLDQSDKIETKNVHSQSPLALEKISDGDLDKLEEIIGSITENGE